MTTRRDFLKHSALGAAGLTIGGLGFSTESYANIMGANEKIRVGIVGFSDRARYSLIPSFMGCFLPGKVWKEGKGVPQQ